jgi:hypothetical protein
MIFVPSAGATAMGHKLNVVDASELTVADWAAVRRVNRAYDARGIEAFWDELEKLDELQAFRVASAFFLNLIRELVRDHMAEYGLTIDDWRVVLKKAEDAARFQ